MKNIVHKIHIHILHSNLDMDLFSSVLNLDECIIVAAEKYSLSGGTASANFAKKNTLQSGSSARAVPPGVSHFSAASNSVLEKREGSKRIYSQKFFPLPNSEH